MFFSFEANIQNIIETGEKAIIGMALWVIKYTSNLIITLTKINVDTR